MMNVSDRNINVLKYIYIYFKTFYIYMYIVFQKTNQKYSHIGTCISEPHFMNSRSVYLKYKTYREMAVSSL